jgi:hypothetical protein
MSLPGRLYKYCPLNMNVLRLLMHSKIYYARPDQFNDPLDCKPSISLGGEVGTFEFAYELINLRTNRNTSEDFKNMKAAAKFEKFRDPNASEDYEYKKVIAAEIVNIIHNEFKDYGVLCLSDTWNSVLMWSHYADQHRGICIEYNTSGYRQFGIYPISYTSNRNIEIIDIIKWKNENDQDSKLYVRDAFFFRKSAYWKDENEFRMIKEIHGELDLDLPISAIYCGYKCEDDVLLAALLAKRHDVKLFKVKASDNSFKLDRDDVDIYAQNYKFTFADIAQGAIPRRTIDELIRMR